jgi:hypothetical protein
MRIARHSARCFLLPLASLFAAAGMLCAQMPDTKMPENRMVERGTVDLNGKTTKYLIRRLPVSSFTELPAPIATELEKRECMIPQSYQAHRAENVVHGSFEGAGSSDWAALCSTGGKVRLLVFFASAPAAPLTLDEADEKTLLEAHDPSGVFGFDWGLDAATPLQVHQAQAGMEHRPAAPLHDAVALVWIEHHTRYRLYEKQRWIDLEMPE